MMESGREGDDGAREGDGCVRGVAGSWVRDGWVREGDGWARARDWTRRIRLKSRVRCIGVFMNGTNIVENGDSEEEKGMK